MVCPEFWIVNVKCVCSRTGTRVWKLYNLSQSSVTTDNTSWNATFFLKARAEPILPIFLSNNLKKNTFCSIFCSLSSYFSTHKRFFLVYLQLLSMHDCCIRVIHNMMTALLEYLNLIAVFPEAYIDLILFFYCFSRDLHLCNAK